MIKEEITAYDVEELERLVQIKESQGWIRVGDVEQVAPPPSGFDGKVGLTSFCQEMEKEDEVTPQD